MKCWYCGEEKGLKVYDGVCNDCHKRVNPFAIK